METIVIHFRCLLDSAARENRFEEPLDALLRAQALGYLSGGGTDLLRLRSDISLEVHDAQMALPLVRAELKRLRAPWFTSVHVLPRQPKQRTSVTVGDLIAIPAGEGQQVLAKVLVVSESLKEHGYLLLGIYCRHSVGLVHGGLPAMPLASICTFATFIQSGEWQTVGHSALTPEERRAFPGPDFDLVGITVHSRSTAEAAAARVIATGPA